MSPRQAKRELDELDKRILKVIYRWINGKGLPPTVREIQEEVGASSTSVVDYHLRRLEQRGYIIRDNAQDGQRKARNIRLAPLPRGVDATEEDDINGLHALAARRHAGKTERQPAFKKTSQGVSISSHVVPVPLAGQIVASEPVPSFSDAFADENIAIPQSLLPRTTQNLYALRVSGNSMIDALISDGDIVVLQEVKDAAPGEMVAVWLKDTEESTLKRFAPEYDKDNQLQRIVLKPANPTMQPIVIDDPSRVEIRGKVVLVIRTTDNTIGKPKGKIS